MKTLELLGIIGSVVTVGIALGAVIIGSNDNLHAELRTEMQELRAEVRTEVRELRADVHTEVRELRADVHTEVRELRTEVSTEVRELRTEVSADMHALEMRLSSVERRLAKFEGLLEGLRDAIAAQGRADPRAESPA